MDAADRDRVFRYLAGEPGFRESSPRDLERFVQAVRMVRAPHAATLMRQGEYGDSLFLILSGSAVVRLRRAGGEETILAILRRGEVCGELSLFGQRPRAATVTANEPLEAIEVPREALGKLLKASPALLQRFDRLYRRRAAAANIFADPLFSDLSPQALEQLIESSRLRRLRKEEVVIAQGDPADAFYIVWNGYLRVSARVEGRERIFAYLHEGDYFGETALVERVPRTATVTANEDAQVIEVRRDDFQRLIAADPGAAERLRQKVAERLAQAASIKARPTLMLFIEDMLKLGTAHATSALLIDLETCVGCGNCSKACQERYGHSRLVRRGKEYVLPGGQARVLMPASCWHCRDPECMIGCPTDALRRQPTGEISVLAERCIGCEICANQCPWGNITMAPAPNEPRTHLGRLFARVREALVAARGGPAADEGPSGRGRIPGKAVKCDLCRGFGAAPACIAACPYDSIRIADPNVFLRPAEPAR